MLVFSGVTSASNGVLKLMGSYLVFAFTGFVMTLLFLERIGAKSDPDKSCLQVRVNTNCLFFTQILGWNCLILIIKTGQCVILYVDLQSMDP